MTENFTSELMCNVLQQLQANDAVTHETLQRLDRRISAIENTLLVIGKSIAGIHSDITALTERVTRQDPRLNLNDTN